MTFFANLNIGKRLALGFALILMLTVLIAGAGVWRLQRAASDTHSMMSTSLAKERLIADWYTQVFGAVRRTAAIAKSSDPDLGPFFKDDIAATAKVSADLIKQIEPLISPGLERTLYDRIIAQRTLYASTRDSAVKAKAAGDSEQARRIFDEAFVPAASGYQDLLRELVARQRAEIDASAAAIDASESMGTRLIVALTAGAVLLGAVVSWLLATGIVRPIRAAVSVAETVAAGKLSRHIEVRGKDETAALLRALGNMNDNLTAIVTEVRGGTETIATASAEISSGNMNLSSRTEEQASALVETAASMDELTTRVRNNADNARQANALSISASEVAVKGGAVVSQVIATMSAIEASSSKIVDIIGVIDGIAFQTNILALNAAVEAARAGEQGRGFAVVASEVRTLAQRSAAAAKEIKALIGHSVEQVKAGTRLVDEAGATMEQVVNSVQQVSGIVGEITAASLEQSSGIEHVNQAIGQMEAVTQQNAALVEESAAAAASMLDQAGKLAQAVSLFRLDETSEGMRKLSRPVAQAGARPRLGAGINN